MAVSPAYAAQPSTSPLIFSPIDSGNNFATGSARINLVTTTSPDAALIPPVSTQVTHMLARGPLDPNALYAISGGHNDVFAQLSAGSNAAAVAGIVTAANDLTAQITRLQSAGARHLIVVGIMDMTKTPIASMPGNVPDPLLLGNLVSSFNAVLESGLAGKNLLYFNTGKMLDTVIANPAAYGFTNVTDAATSSSLGHAPDPGKETAYLFADIRHPSAQFHKIMSEWIYSSLEGASRVGTMSLVPLGRSGAQWRSIDGRFNQFQNFGYKGQGFFVTGDYASSQKDAYAGAPSVDGFGSSLIMGYEKAFGDQLFAGVTLGYGNAPFDLGNNQGTVKYNEWALSAFASQKFGAFYVNGLATYSWLDYESKRNIALGPLNTSEQGDTRGDQFGVKGQIGYNFTLGNIIH
ncbi:MAG: autotransporter domain-containing protein, partial [Azonexus sp.]|nr:autotransporter domain-containing protein [Azonexus sp.]